MLSHNPSVTLISDHTVRYLNHQQHLNRPDTSLSKDLLTKNKFSSQLHPSSTPIDIDSPAHATPTKKDSIKSVALIGQKVLSNNRSSIQASQSPPAPDSSNLYFPSDRPVSRVTLKSLPRTSSSPSSLVSSPVCSSSPVSTPVSSSSPSISVLTDLLHRPTKADLIAKTAIDSVINENVQLRDPIDPNPLSIPRPIGPAGADYPDASQSASPSETTVLGPALSLETLPSASTPFTSLSSSFDQSSSQHCARMIKPSSSPSTLLDQPHPRDLNAHSHQETGSLSQRPPSDQTILEQKPDTSVVTQNGHELSKSPSIGAAPSSPKSQQRHPKPPKTRRTPTVPIRVPIEPGQCLVFGRKPDMDAVSSEVTPKSTLAAFNLPKSFTHASRTHCLCTLIAPPLGGLNIRIVVKGQNGLMVDGERFEEGSSAGVELERRDGEQIELGFYGGKKVECYVRLDESSSGRVRGRAGAPNLSENGHSERQSLSATSRGSKRRKTNNLTRPKASPEVSPREQSALPTQAFSPRSPASEVVTSNSGFSNSDSVLSALSAGDRVRALIPSLGLDLVGLIASAIVFSSRATISTTQVIRAVLETQPSLAEAVLSHMPNLSAPQNTTTLESKGENGAHDMDTRPESAGPNGFFHIKTERETCSAPLPSDYPIGDTADTKPSPLDLKDFPCFESPVDSTYLQALPIEDKIDRVAEACRPVILDTLKAGWRADGTGMFGCVTNEGLKDASGEPLEALWYYQPQRDFDLERRSNLQPYVRHIRHTQTTSKQYFFKKVRGSGRRRS